VLKAKPAAKRKLGDAVRLEVIDVTPVPVEVDARLIIATDPDQAGPETPGIDGLQTCHNGTKADETEIDQTSAGTPSRRCRGRAEAAGRVTGGGLPVTTDAALPAPFSNNPKGGDSDANTQ
jgi:hypothetical protein